MLKGKVRFSPLDMWVAGEIVGFAEKSVWVSCTSRSSLRLATASYWYLTTLASSVHWISHLTSVTSKSSREETLIEPSRFAPKATV